MFFQLAVFVCICVERFSIALDVGVPLAVEYLLLWLLEAEGTISDLQTLLTGPFFIDLGTPIANWHPVSGSTPHVWKGIDHVLEDSGWEWHSG